MTLSLHTRPPAATCRRPWFRAVNLLFVRWHGLEQGVINVCSKYGSIELVGSDESTGRVDVVLRNPFPHGDRAVNDTKLAIELRRDGNRLYVVSVSLRRVSRRFERRSREAPGQHANVRITLPKRADYRVHLVANHHYMSVRDLTIGGSFEGYGSPGVTIDADLADPFSVRVSGTTYHGEVTDDPAVAAALTMAAGRFNFGRGARRRCTSLTNKQVTWRSS